jgi:hypothetical protein
MDAFLKDLKHSARMFLRTPGFTIAATAALALGIATNTAIFSVVNTILLKPFAYSDPERIVMFQNTLRDVRFGSAAPTEFDWWRQQTEAFEDISAYDFSVANWINLAESRICLSLRAARSSAPGPLFAFLAYGVCMMIVAIGSALAGTGDTDS